MSSLPSHICLNRSILTRTSARWRRLQRRHHKRDMWWCSCRRCKAMPTEGEGVCCNEWAVGMPPLELIDAANERTEHCLTQQEGFLPLLSRTVLEIVFSLPCINWRRKVEYIAHLAETTAQEQTFLMISEDVWTFPSLARNPLS